ncbi:hypothetical protein [Rubripirellula reticaptiva]|uniref:hypothetical protein n=1 Tax=Rubripirellula reticaptiva TaxID=2528013 RepID=UPI0016491EF5|nr:hypothetical protein [Rubripirellula reticaptiva]
MNTPWSQAASVSAEISYGIGITSWQLALTLSTGLCHVSGVLESASETENAT